ncbi:hypothetical protein AD930_12870 [Acetobacter malorum]|nr:hypothetical protein AD930_12870 [Acetobacter malorum]
MNGVRLSGSNGGDCLGRKNGRLFFLFCPVFVSFSSFRGYVMARYRNFIRTLQDAYEIASFFVLSLNGFGWFNNLRILPSIRNIPSPEDEVHFYAQQKSHALAA